MQDNYFKWIGIHIGIGLFAYFLKPLVVLYTLCIFVFGMYWIVKTQNRNHEALVMACYTVTVELLLRMTDGMIFNEFGKYSIMLYLLVGMLYRGFSKNAIPYWIYLLFLVPGVFIGASTLGYNVEVRKAIAFNISGPVCLAISAIYCYRRRIQMSRVIDLLQVMALPFTSILVYIIFYNPNIKEVVRNTSSNFETSGGFGPNQVSTILGLGMFLFLCLVLFRSQKKSHLIYHALMLALVSYRGLVTFSRGGIMTGIVMVGILLILLYLRGNLKTKGLITIVAGAVFLGAVGIWTYSVMQTGGMLALRYANKGVNGKEKTSKLSGRENLIASEFEMFIENPILGVGVGRNKEVREEMTGEVAASHNELSRMLAEHGSFGIACLMIMLCTPTVLYLYDRGNIFALGFVIFAILTMNHAAMRMAAPAFIYALSLFKIVREEAG